MKLSIIIPVYNEEKNINKVIDQVLNSPIKMPKEIILVDDGSTDKTKEILKKFHGPNIKLIYLKKNAGKGAAIRTGLKCAQGDIILIQDADLEYNVNDYPKLIQPLVEGKAKVVYGSRFKGKISGMKKANFLANKILAMTASILYGQKITDEATAYKAFKKEVIKSISLKCKRFEFCPEVTAKIAKRGIRIVEVPINYQGRDVQNGKKIRLRDAFEAFWTLIKYRFKD